MARKSKAKMGLDYFPFDVDFFADMKVRRLIRHNGGHSITIYSYLLCLIYNNGYYIKMNDDLSFIIHEATDMDEKYIDDVIQYCLEIDLLNKGMYLDFGILTSKGIQERFNNINKLCRRKARIEEFSLLTSEDDEQSKEKESKEKESKEKESKGKESKGKEINLDFIEVEYRLTFTKWLEYKKEIKDSYALQRTIESAYKALKLYSKGNPQLADYIVERSIANQWKGLFEVDDENVLKRFENNQQQQKTKPQGRLLQ